MHDLPRHPDRAFAGMLPLARELVKRGVTVIMAANERPSINDTTAAEMSIAVRSAAQEDKLLRRALDEQALSVMSSGSDMPVIDLSRVRESQGPALPAAVALVHRGCALLVAHRFRCTVSYSARDAGIEGAGLHAHRFVGMVIVSSDSNVCHGSTQGGLAHHLSYVLNAFA